MDTVREFDLLTHLQRQREWSEKTFGTGSRAKGVVDHIRKELCEIEADPGDLKEWIDVVILAFDGAWRSGAKPQEIIDALVSKQTKNEHRVWPDWRQADPNKAIEHDRSRDTAKFYVLPRDYASSFVKEGEFFRSQGGLRETWGMNWIGVEADSIEDARKKADAMVVKKIQPIYNSDAPGGF